MRDKDFNIKTNELPYYGKGIYILMDYFSMKKFFIKIKR